MRDKDNVIDRIMVLKNIYMLLPTKEEICYLT